MRVGGAASSVAGLVVGAGSVGGGADLGRGVGGGAAGGGGLADLERLGLRPLDGAGNGKAQEGSQGSEGLVRHWSAVVARENDGGGEP